jgi:hypothetical protein
MTKEVKVAKLDVDSEGSRAALADVVYDQTQRRANISSLTLRGEWGDIMGNGVIALDAANRSQGAGRHQQRRCRMGDADARPAVHRGVARLRQGPGGLAGTRVSPGDW